jgi:O-antigen ligase
MQPAIPLLGFDAVPTDFIYLALAAALLVARAVRSTPLLWDRSWGFIAFYFFAMLASALAAGLPAQSLTKLLTQLYLLSLPVAVVCLVRDERHLRSALLAWLVGTGIVALVGVTAVVAFWIDPGILLFARSDYGSLPPGAYPRLRLTFLNPNMLCNYLTVSLVILLVAHAKRWIAGPLFLLLLGGVLVSAAFTISTGLGGIALAIAFWLWLVGRSRRPAFARLCLAGGVAAAIAFVLSAAASPVLPPNPPFVIRIPGLDVTLAPAVRLVTWMDALRSFLSEPLFGRGIGTDAVMVRYQVASGDVQLLTDAHNTYLNLAAQSGLIGVAALVALLVFVIGRMRPLQLEPLHGNLSRVGLGFAFLNAFAYQGLTGSFEDARHLWLLFGLFVAAGHVEVDQQASRPIASP